MRVIFKDIIIHGDMYKKVSKAKLWVCKTLLSLYCKSRRYSLEINFPWDPLGNKTSWYLAGSQSWFDKVPEFYKAPSYTIWVTALSATEQTALKSYCKFSVSATLLNVWKKTKLTNKNGWQFPQVKQISSLSYIFHTQTPRRSEKTSQLCILIISNRLQPWAWPALGNSEGLNYYNEGYFKQHPLQCQQWLKVVTGGTEKNHN